MKPNWQPLIPIRFVERDGKRIAQQAWGKYVYTGDEWTQTHEYEWRDVPLMSEIDDNPRHWCQVEDE
jgi:hypothetical protein